MESLSYPLLLEASFYFVIGYLFIDRFIALADRLSLETNGEVSSFSKQLGTRQILVLFWPAWLVFLTTLAILLAVISIVKALVKP